MISKRSSYVAVNAKLMAMRKNLITQEDMLELLKMGSPNEIARSLKQLPSYSVIMSQMSENELKHRGYIEQVIRMSIYEDFTRLYKFSTGSVRHFLKIQFIKYEIDILKSCLNSIFDHRNISTAVGSLAKYLDRHSSLDVIALTNCLTVDEFVDILRGSDYYDALKHIGTTVMPSLFDYELALDLHYFNLIWKKRKLLFDQVDSRVIKSCFGTLFDLLNLILIYRCKEYYNISSAAVQSLLIPKHHRINVGLMNALVEAKDVKEMNLHLASGYYFNKYGIGSISELESRYPRIVKASMKAQVNHMPRSIAPIAYYLYQKEQEINGLITTLECVRYKLPYDVAKDKIITN